MTDSTSSASYESFNQSNDGYTNANIIAIRLDTGPLLDNLEAFYRGSRIVGYSKDDGVLKPKFQTVGRPLMNDNGIQSVMGWLTLMFSPQTVQGNKKEEDYIQFMVRLEEDLSQDLMINIHDYGITEQDFPKIVDQTIAAADMFFSRTINNKERESYAQTMKSVERVGQEPKQGIMGMISPFARQ